MSISIQKPFAPMALLALAMSVRDNLLGCGHTVFRNGDAECIKKYTSGMQDLVQLMKRLEVLGQIVSFSCLEKKCLADTNTQFNPVQHHDSSSPPPS